MNSINLSSYSLTDLTEALRVLKSYTTSFKQIGNRARLEDGKNPEPLTIRVEYAPGSDEGFIREFSKNIFAQFFKEADASTCQYIENKKITGGIRIFLGDDMVDISFEKFAHLIKNA